MGYDDYEGYSAKFAPGPEGCEELEMYQEGGYHPIEIGDELCDGKYTIIHKLGSGAVATVWLATANIDAQSTYVALKMLTAGHSTEDNNELTIHTHLKQKAQQGHKVSAVAALLDSFWIEGPNGTHLCLAFEVSGPSVASLSYQWGRRKIRPDVVRNLAKQSAHALQNLHDAGVVYGDLSAANILLRLVDISDWSLEKVYESFGHPQPVEIQTADGETVPSCAPKVVYEPIQFQNLGTDLLRPEIIFIDLADAQLFDSPAGEPSGYSLGYAAPESLWFKEVQSQASDIWALACVWFEMRSASKLIEEGSGGEEEIQIEIMELIGPAPASWQEAEAGDDADGASVIDRGTAEPDDQNRMHVDVEAQSSRPESVRSIRFQLMKAWKWIKSLFGKTKMSHEPPEVPEENNQPPTADVPEYFQPRRRPKEDTSLSGRIRDIGTWREWHYLTLDERVRRIQQFYAGSGDPQENVTTADVVCEPPPSKLSEEEQADFEDLLSSMMKYGKGERASLSQIASHPWLKKTYGDAGDDAWLKPYALGRQFEIF